VYVDILLTNQTIDYSQYDLLHFFNIIHPADILSTHIAYKGALCDFHHLRRIRTRRHR